jgi:hypothetical protein
MGFPPNLAHLIRRRHPAQAPNAFRDRPWLGRVKRLGAFLLLAGAAAGAALMPAAQPQYLITVTQVPYLLGTVACLAAAAAIMTFN